MLDENTRFRQSTQKAKILSWGMVVSYSTTCCQTGSAVLSNFATSFSPFLSRVPNRRRFFDTGSAHRKAALAAKRPPPPLPIREGFRFVSAS